MIGLHIFHYAGFFGAQIFNTVLAILIVKRAGKLFGSYRHVMFVFTFCSMLYSAVEIIAQPVLYMKGPMFVVFLDNNVFSQGIGNVVACLHCGTFGFLISVFAAQFFYRYIALCRQSLLSYFDGYKIFLIFIPCVITYILWFELVVWGMSATMEKRIYLKDDFKNMYESDSMMISFIAPLYWNNGPNREKVWRFKDAASALVCTGIIGSLTTLICFFALRIYLKMQKEKGHMSKRTLELNRQLYIMLSIQTIVPFITMYIPVGLFIVLPFFDMGLGAYVNYPSASMSLYPAIEPLIAIYCIKDFRKTIANFFRRVRVGPNGISVYSTSGTQMAIK
ncbi:Serpentine receptor class r-10 [Caenorhabditis elegans]|uniref:Serpentine receptor class r-10 n=1 Tax=Caenorhabditis elegans TaxID=6239 RepID=Q20547_CAEEL|nr:Seven TM Receptor [Caenorhabditis elegans]CAA98484.1 Seven TM Receptor [Caenorhabditis elegans]|eukprot:NP_505878.1 Seven TM Receptor [Caenorhabditis elegans]